MPGHNRYNQILPALTDHSMNTGLPEATFRPDKSITTEIASVPQLVVLDTCVLISTVLKNLLLRLAQTGMFQPIWADYIGQEWRRNAARIWDVADTQILQEWQQMQLAFPQANMGVVSEFEAGLFKSDVKDWHVIAAGRAALSVYPERSACVLTRNLRDFNRSELREHGLSLFSPDDFLILCYEQNPELFMQFLALIPDDAVSIGKAAEPLETVLRRERLFRLSNLVMQDADTAA